MGRLASHTTKTRVNARDSNVIDAFRLRKANPMDPLASTPRSFHNTLNEGPLITLMNPRIPSGSYTWPVAPAAPSSLILLAHLRPFYLSTTTAHYIPRPFSLEFRTRNSWNSSGFNSFLRLFYIYLFVPSKPPEQQGDTYTAPSSTGWLSRQLSFRYFVSRSNEEDVSQAERN